MSSEGAPLDGVESWGLGRRGRPRLPGPILLVEDDPDLSDLLSELLGDSGYEVRRSSSVAEALGVLDGGVMPPLVLLDWTLEGVGGAGLLAELERRGSGAQVLLCTGVQESESDPLPLERVSGLVRKPFAAEELLAAIEAALLAMEGSLAP